MLNIAKINLNALWENAYKIKKSLNAGVKFCAVVKADAYGHGAPVVANHLYPLVDCFAVALVEEGIELRRGGIDKDILVLTPVFTGDIRRAVENELILTVENKAQILLIERESERQNKTTKIHLKFNVGMNRFGVDNIDELKELLECAKHKKRVKIDGMYSHLPNPQNKKLLKIAENRFLLANKLVKGYNNKAICHLSSSGGYLMGKQFDMVRIGILLYGYKPFKTNKISVKPVMKVYSKVVRSRALCVGDSALYGEFSVKEKTQVQIIRFGYADGLERKAVQGQVNNRCMDITMLEKKSKSNSVLVMSNAKKLADEYDTIPYEILVKVGMRARKIYIR